jgi:hypothetical protein
MDLQPFTLFWLGLLYLVLGIGFYTPTRESGPAKTAYFLAFPFHAIAIPLASAFVRGMGDMFQSKVFQAVSWVIAFLLLLLLMAVARD